MANEADEDVEALLAALDEEPEPSPSEGPRPDVKTDDQLSEAVSLDTRSRTLYTRIREETSSIAGLTEVADIVTDPWQYAAVLEALVERQTLKFLPGSAKLAVELATADVLNSLVLPDSVMAMIKEVQELHQQKVALLANLSEKVGGLAPNVLEIIAVETAVQLLAWTGGLSQLAVTPPANLGNAGKQQVNEESILQQDPLIQQLPQQFRRQAVRIVAGKVVLAARVDISGPCNAELGRQWRSQIENRIDKLLAPPPPLRERALPAPIDKPSKRRGGRKVRRLKQKYGITEVQRQSQQVPFAVAGAGGSIRKASDRPSTLRVSKAMEQRLENSKTKEP